MPQAVRRSLATLFALATAMVSQPALARQPGVSIVRTSFGIPHITARDWRGLGYGYGYVAAEDNLCILADAFVTFRGERSRYFGGDGRRPKGGTLGTPVNLESDFFFRQVADDAQIARFRGAQPADLDALIAGYAAGYSRYAGEVRGGGHAGRHADCRDAPWLTAASAEDIYRRLYALSLTASSINFIEAIGGAQPPAKAGAATAERQRPQQLAWTLPSERDPDFGSNMFGFGSEATGSKHGLLLGNPHWYWKSVDRFQQVHLKIPGKIDVQGVSIVGVPVVQVGFNRDVAWSHTVSTASRFTLYKLKLVDGDPTAYLYDGKVRRMTSRPITVQVKAEDGSLRAVTRTLYRSHYGSMLATGWTGTEAVTIRDVNAENFRLYRNWLRLDQAKNLDDFIRIQREEVAIPWVNTVAVGRNDNRAWYADIGTVPNVSDAKRAACGVAKATLDGSRSDCEWDVDADTPQPGALGVSKLPSIERRDYVANMNDSYWLANPKAPLTGYPTIIGAVDYEQSLRTRMGHRLVQDRFAGADGLAGHGITSESLRDITLNNRVLSAELFLDAVLEGPCRKQSIRLADPAADVDVSKACGVLAKWDRRGNADSVGAHIWDRFWEEMKAIPSETRYSVPFDPARPLETPRGLRVELPAIEQAFAAAVRVIERSGVPLDAPRSAYQYLTDADGTKIPIAGGCGPLGYFAIACTQITEEGPVVGGHGNSYIQVVGFDDKGVVPYTLEVPSQSTDPASPWYRDYTRAYARKAWHRAPFTEQEIRRTTVAKMTLVE
ncbi:penicillin acylase family protein [Sphingomonas colocasiae]|uniref:Penicillin acylase family protein n=1 Tax=Sphingomonas colocasiae TaxID=1848973 RepID=A0ABS7PM96_9SPHN|nr:penicillin acylase family protein [Sphingomonas colocasiae]MBY8822346.1 penicillin acylase family protein [Sphingomonas colocasiae]